MRLALIFMTLITTLSACAEFPALDGTVSPALDGSFPDLVPLTPILTQATASDSGASNVQATMTPRLANLRARAARLRGPVIPPAARARMLRGVS